MRMKWSLCTQVTQRDPSINSTTLRDTCRGHNGNEWLRQTEGCDGEDKIEVDAWTKLQVPMSTPKEIPLALSGDNE
jgi:hypothetical protein